MSLANLSPCLPVKTTPKKRCHDWTRKRSDENLTDFQRFTRDEVDWANSPLGPPAQWPPQLTQMVLVMISDSSPSVIFWGDPDEVVVIYNEAYTALIGTKHPTLQGQLARIGLAEVWDYFDNLLRQQVETGLTVIGEAQPFVLLRHGFLEESFFSFKFIPIIDPIEGVYSGSYETVVEHTSEVLYERRAATIKSLEDHVFHANSMSDLWTAIIKGLENNAKDLPLVMLYSVTVDHMDTEDQITTCVLRETLGVQEGHNIAPTQFVLERDQFELAAAFRKGASQGSPLILRKSDGGLPHGIVDGIDWRGHGAPCDNLLIYTIRDDSHKSALGFLVAALNPRRPYDTLYQDFIRALTDQLITPHVSKMLLREEIEAGKLAAARAKRESIQLGQQLAAKTAAFEHSELKFTRFADRLPMGIAITDRGGNIIYGNSVWRHFVGIPEGSNDTFDLAQCAEPNQEEAIASLSADLIAGKAIHSLLHLKTRWTASDGNQHPITALISAYNDVAQDGTMTIISCVADVSELRWIGTQLRQRTAQIEVNEARYRNFAEHAPVGVCILGMDRLVNYANESFFDIMAQPTLNKDILTLIHPEDVEMAEGKLNSVAAGQESVTFECRLVKHTSVEIEDVLSRTEESAAWILASAHLETKPDAQIVCWVTDITAQKVAQNVIRRRMDEAIELKSQQERFIDMTSHEIRNPLSALIHCTDEIIEACRNRVDNLVEDTLDAAQTIEYCAKHIRNIVGDVLTLSKLDSNLVEMCPVPAQPKEFINNSLKMFSGEVRAAGIDFEYIEDRSIQDLDIDWLVLDPNRVVQVLINLVTNAIKFTKGRPQRRVITTVTASRTVPQPESCDGLVFVPQRRKYRPVPFGEQWAQSDSIYLIISVEDTGPGLTEPEKALLFKRFSQASPKTESKYGGSGLGLFICRDLTELQGGGIGVSSQAGIGSRFVFYVHTKQATAPDQHRRRGSSKATSSVTPGFSVPKISPDHSQSDEQSLSSRKVLVVDDNMVNLKVVCRQLRKRGYEVSTAVNGAEALKLIHARASLGTAFDVVLMDVEMPVMDGVTCVKRIRAYEAKGELQGHLYVIAVTANARDEQARTALDAGMDALTTKPYRMDDLVSQIENVGR